MRPPSTDPGLPLEDDRERALQEAPRPRVERRRVDGDDRRALVRRDELVEPGDELQHRLEADLGGERLEGVEVDEGPARGLDRGADPARELRRTGRRPGVARQLDLDVVEPDAGRRPERRRADGDRDEPREWGGDD